MIGSVRPATPSDFEAVNEILHETFGFRHSRRFYLQKIEEGRMHVYDLGGDLAGVIDIVTENKHLYIVLLAVRKDYRGRGIGKRLVEFAEETARRLGLKDVVVKPKYSVAEYYRRLGFVYKDKHTMVKPLQNGRLQ